EHFPAARELDHENIVGRNRLPGAARGFGDDLRRSLGLGRRSTGNQQASGQQEQRAHRQPPSDDRAGLAELCGPRYRPLMYLATVMLLGWGELGREFGIAAKRLGCRLIACDRYANAPAMQIADASEVFSMLDGKALRAAVEKRCPDFIVP